MAPRKRSSPDFLQIDSSPKKISKSSTSFGPWIFLAINTEEDPDGFYLARVNKNNYPDSGDFTVRWLSKRSPKGLLYRLDYSDTVNTEMVIGEVEVVKKDGNNYRLSIAEKNRIKEDDESDDNKKQRPVGKSTSLKRKSSKTASKAGEISKKAKKEQTKKPKKLPKNYVIPNSELIPKEKIKLLPESDCGFLTTSSCNSVSPTISSKLLIRAVLHGDMKTIQHLLNDPAKCPNIQIHRSVDIEDNALMFAFKLGNVKAMKAIAKEMYSPNAKKRPSIPYPMLVSMSSGTYNARSLGVPFIRDVMMSRGGREGINALNQDAAFCGEGDTTYVTLQNNIPLERVEELKEEIEKSTNNTNRSLDLLHRFNNKIDWVLIHGHYQLAAKLLEKAKNEMQDTFNYLHVGCLKEKDVKSLGAIRAASVTKKSMRNNNISPLHCAAINPNPEFLKAFLRVSPDYNITDRRGRRPVHYAAACQSDAPLKVLLSAGVPYFEPDTNGCTPLIYASIVGRTKNVEALLAHAKSDQESSSSNDDASLAAQAIISKFGPCAINKTGRNGLAALHHAAKRNQLDVCKLLLENGADVETVGGSEKQTALIIAAAHGNFVIVKHLIEKGGALIEKKDKKMRNALILAVKNGHTHVTAYLLRKGSDPNSVDSSGNRAIHYAAAYGWLDIVELLLQAGADPSIENDWNMTALAVSYLKGHIGVTRQLLKLPGADVNFRDKNGQTLVMLTCQASVCEAVLTQLTFLINQMNADATLNDIYGCNALHFLASSNDDRRFDDEDNDCDGIREKMAKLLIEAGCSPKAMNLANKTSVNVALECRKSALVELLLDNGGAICCKPDSVTLRNSFHIMASSCMTEDYKKILDSLKKKVDKADLTKMNRAKDKDGFTPLMLAAQSYCNGVPPGGVKDDSPEFRAWVKQGIEFMRRIIEDFGADVKQTASIVRNEKRITDETNEEDYDEDDEEEEEEDNDEDSNEDTEENDSNDTDRTVPKKKCPSTFVHFLILPKRAPPALDFLRKFKPNMNVYDNNGETPAISVADKAGVDSMKLLVSCGADLNLPTKDPNKTPGMTPVFIAASSNRIEMLTYLVSEVSSIDFMARLPKTGDSIASLVCGKMTNSVDERLKCLEVIADKQKPIYVPNWVNNEARTLLMLAIGANKRQVDSSHAIEQFLIERGGDVHRLCDDKGRTALHWVFVSSAGSTMGNTKMLDNDKDPVDLLNLLISSIPDPTFVIDIKDAEGRTPLHYAAACGSAICCIRLLARGANVDALDYKGNTPLSLAVKNGRKSVVLVLIRSDPNLNVTVENCEEPVEIQNRLEWAPKSLQKKNQNLGKPVRIDLFSAIIKLEWQGLTALLIDVLIDKNQGVLFDLIQATLMQATYNLAVNLLSKAKTKPALLDIVKNGKGSASRNLYAYLALGATNKSAQKSEKEVIKVANILDELGCSSIQADAHGCLPFHYACLNQYEPMIKHLSARAKNAKLLDVYNRSPVHALFWNLVDVASVERIKKLLPLVSSVDRKLEAECDFPPLESAAPPSMDKLSFIRRDYFNCTYPSPSTCLIRAILSRRYDLVAATLQAGADASATGGNNFTPLMAAVQANCVESFIILLSKQAQKEVMEDKNPMKLHNRLVLSYLKPYFEGGKNFTPEELQQALKEALAKKKNASASPVKIKAYNIFGQEDDDDEEYEDDEYLEEEEYDEDELSDKQNKPDVPKIPPLKGKLPYLLPGDVFLASGIRDMKIKRDCSIDYSVLTKIEVPKNDRKLNLRATETQAGNSALHLAMSSPYRESLEMRFMAHILSQLDPHLLILKNKAGITPPQAADDINLPKLDRKKSSVSIATKAQVMEINEISHNWMARMESLADDRRKQEKIDPEKELIPDRRFSSYTSSKLVRHEASGRLYDVLMSKIDFGWYAAQYNFYQLQLIKMSNTDLYVVFTRWGRIGTDGMFQQTPFKAFSDAEQEFMTIFKQKTGNDWKKYLESGFHPVSKKYQLVTLDRPDRFSQLKTVKIDLKIAEIGFKMPKESFGFAKAIVESSLRTINDGTIFQRLKNIHLTPFGLVDPTSLQKAYGILKELNEVVEKIGGNKPVYGRFRNSRSKSTDNDQMADYEKIHRLSEEYYHIVPRTGFAYCEVYPLESKQSVKDEMKKIDVLLNFQGATRLLLAAAEEQKRQNPCDFIFNAMSTGLSVLNGSNKEAQDILQYIQASWNPNEGKAGIEAIYKLDRPKEAERQLKSGNRRLLWHGTCLDNLLGILSTGLQATPEGVSQCGQIFGDGVYLADSFEKSMSYCDFDNSKPCYMLLCDVALGKVAVPNISSYAKNATGPDPKNCDTLVILSTSIPDPRFTATIDDVAIPYGGAVNSKTTRSLYRQHSEYVVKNSDQIVLKYIVQFRRK